MGWKYGAGVGAKLYYVLEEKFCHHNFMKKGHSKLSENEPENIP